LVHPFLGRAGGDVARDEVSEGGIAPLQSLSGMSFGGRMSLAFLGTQTRPSFRRDSLIRVSLACFSPPEGGMQVGWIWVKQGFAIPAPRLWARQMAVTLQFLALVLR